MDIVQINRAPLLTLWAVVVAGRLGFRQDEALTIGKAPAGVTAHAMGTRLGVFEPTPAAIKTLRAEQRAEAGVFPVAFMGRHMPVLPTEDGLRAVGKDKPITPASVERYLTSKIGDSLDAVTQAMESLARSRTPGQLAGDAFDLYMAFRPRGVGWKSWLGCQWLFAAAADRCARQPEDGPLTTRGIGPNRFLASDQ